MQQNCGHREHQTFTESQQRGTTGERTKNTMEEYLQNSKDKGAFGVVRSTNHTWDQQCRYCRKIGHAEREFADQKQEKQSEGREGGNQSKGRGRPIKEMDRANEESEDGT